MHTAEVLIAYNLLIVITLAGKGVTTLRSYPVATLGSYTILPWIAYDCQPLKGNFRVQRFSKLVKSSAILPIKTYFARSITYSL